jgi:hypothetical protein
MHNFALWVVTKDNQNKDMTDNKREQITVVKVGGAVVEDPEQLAMLLENFSAIKGK